MNATIQIVTMNKTDACHAAIAEIVGFADKAVRKMQFQELIKEMANLNMCQTLTNV